MKKGSGRFRKGLIWIWLAIGCGVVPSYALTGLQAAKIVLDSAQSAHFRTWMVQLINHQIQQGPDPRWYHRDCAGLVRFAVAEAFKEHDEKWLRNNGIPNQGLPPDIRLSPQQKTLLQGWTQLDGKRAPFATAQVLIQQNTRAISKDLNQALPGDLLFFDQGDDRHLMVWTGRYIAYHSGTETRTDNGLRAVTIQQLMQWKDTRWRPQESNPNFIGIFRLVFLSP